MIGKVLMPMPMLGEIRKGLVVFDLSQSKQIGWHQVGGAVVNPIRTPDGLIESVQFYVENGNKKPRTVSLGYEAAMDLHRCLGLVLKGVMPDGSP